MQDVPKDGVSHAASQVSTDWKDAFASRSASAFAAALSKNVSLEASILLRPIVGRENVKLVMEAASEIYERLEFKKETKGTDRAYLEWEASAFGGVEIHGVTIITRNEAGAIVNLAIHHRPLGAALQFSAELARRLGDKLDISNHLLAVEDLPYTNRNLLR